LRKGRKCKTFNWSERSACAAHAALQTGCVADVVVTINTVIGPTEVRASHRIHQYITSQYLTIELILQSYLNGVINVIIGVNMSIYIGVNISIYICVNMSIYITVNMSIYMV
jgi:hypothetical protein